jgi:hypothetical protein
VFVGYAIGQLKRNLSLANAAKATYCEFRWLACGEKRFLELIKEGFSAYKLLVSCEMDGPAGLVGSCVVVSEIR